MKYHKPIDDELVHELSPDCIRRNNGCGNCKFCKYTKTTIINLGDHKQELEDVVLTKLSIRKEVFQRLNQIASKFDGKSSIEVLEMIINKIHKKIILEGK
jgi:hypothetical protein